MNAPPIFSTAAVLALGALPLAAQQTAATDTAAAPGASLIVASPAEARFTTAMNAYNAGQYAEAVTALSDFIATFPQDRHREEALYRLAESYRALGRLDDALAAYAYEAKTYPDGLFRVNAELRRGAILYDRQKFDEAIPALQFVADKGDGELQLAAKFLLGRALLATQKEPAARALLEAIATAQPPTKFTGDAAQIIAALDDSQHRYAEALPFWQTTLALATDPAVQATAAARGGWSALEAKLPDVAEKLFAQARQLDAAGEPRRVANTGLLHLLFAETRYREWLELDGAEKDHELDSARAEILYDRGQAEFLLKHWREAVPALDAFIQAYPDDELVVTAAYQRFLADTQLDPTRSPAEGDAYLKTWPKSPYRAQVQLLQAQELARENRFADALPLWQALAQEPAKPGWPHEAILLELARALDELGRYAEAAAAYQNDLDALTAVPPPTSDAGKAKLARRQLQAQARLAVCLEKSNQLLAATNAWNAVRALAPDGSPEQQSALESLGLIYAKGGPNQSPQMAATFRELLDRFPGSPLHALAAFSVGDDLFRNHDYAGAQRLLDDARRLDPKTWEQPATQRLVLGAFGMKDYSLAVGYLNEYDTLPAPADPQAAIAARLPAALFYWLAQTAQQAGKLADAEAFYLRVIRHAEPGDLLAGAWWQLGEVQSARKEWAAAVSSYDNYRGLKPDAKNATTVLLALGRAQLGAGDFDAAKKTGEQALLQEPEGPHSAASRMLLGETAFARGDFPEAAKQFALVATLFDDPQITPQAEARAADAFDHAGDAKSAAAWREKLKAAYPKFGEAAFL